VQRAEALCLLRLRRCAHRLSPWVKDTVRTPATDG